jgi:hypothetical protein
VIPVIHQYLASLPAKLIRESDFNATEITSGLVAT